MKFLLPITFLLSISAEHVHGAEIGRKGSNYDDEFSYQELKDMNISCYPLDSCSSEDEKFDSPMLTLENKCSCHSQCWEYGTCCIDSPYRVKDPMYKCINPTSFDSYYMIHRCPDNTPPDTIWKIHCESESDDESDILRLSPVTSLVTSRTYTNYYCFRCHEETNKYLFWNLEVESYYNGPKNARVHRVTYNQTEMTWMAVFKENSISIPVRLRFEFPNNAEVKPMLCIITYEISDCEETWTDKRVQEKCVGYRSVVYGISGTYRNAYCALCNSETLDNLTCRPLGGSGGGSEGLFRCMMDVSGGRNETCFENEEKTCKGENVVWNSYSKECQELKCLPGLVVKNNVCVKP